MRLYLVRHGQSEANVHPGQFPWDTNCGLTPIGHVQLHRTAEWLASEGVRPDRIIASPLRRTRESASVLAARLHPAAFTFDVRLREVDAGDWHDRMPNNVYDETHALPLPDRYTFRMPGGESWQDAGRRLAATAASHLDVPTLMLVSHYATLQCGVAALLGAPYEQWADFDFPNASVTLLSYDGSRWAAEFVNHSPAAAPVSEVVERHGR